MPGFPPTERFLRLRSLLALDRLLDTVVRDLAEIGWDREEEIVRLLPDHVISILDRYRTGALTAAEVERWANTIEGREDIGLGPENGQLLRAVIFDLANPALEGALTHEIAERCIDRLKTSRG